MTKTFIFLLLVSPAVMVMEGCRPSKATQHLPSPSDTSAIQLFNGKDLSGWYKFIQHRGRDNDVKNVFTVQDGMIRVSGEEYGSIVTNEEYSNYKLVLEYKWGTRTFEPRKENARDNGLLIHSNGKDGGYEGIWMHSIECQIIEGGTGDLLVVGDGTNKFSLSTNVAPEKQNGTPVFDSTGTPVTINGGRINWFGRDPNWKDEKGFRGQKDVEKPIGEWNTMECIAEGNKVSVMLNGVLVNRAFDVTPSRGRIQLQSEGAEIFFRKVELQPLK
jgi:hypothetical protein